jgi:hypothetical protein
MDEVVPILISQIIVPVLTALSVAAGGWIAARLPGPIKDSLYSAIHKRDVEQLLGAMARRAVAQVSPEVATGHGTGDVISYVRTELPVLVNKMGLSDQVLQTLAGAALTKAQAELVPVRVPPVTS